MVRRRWILLIVAVAVFAILAYPAYQGLVLWRGMDPGLGVRGLHRQGITGRGVSVAVIDSWLPQIDHPAFRGRTQLYEPVSFGEFRNPVEEHGSGVVSILAGRYNGVAPEAGVFYWAVDNNADQTPQVVRALHRVVAFNEILPPEKKIRLVNISRGSAGPRDADPAMTAAVAEARKAGMLVLTSNMPWYTRAGIAHRVAGCPVWRDRDDPTHYVLDPLLLQKIAESGDTVQAFLEGRARSDAEKGLTTLYTPGERRTAASPRRLLGYSYDEHGGDSWGVPYAVGALALALQVNPALTVDDLEMLLVEGRSIRPNHLDLINPRKIVELAKAKGTGSAAGK